MIYSRSMNWWYLASFACLANMTIKTFQTSIHYHALFMIKSKAKDGLTNKKVSHLNTRIISKFKHVNY